MTLYTHKSSRRKVAMLSSTVKDKTFQISPSSTTIREGTLSYYFNHNEDFLPASHAPHPYDQIKSTPKNMPSCPKYTKSSASTDHTQHGPPSAHGQWRPLLDADESGTPLSWLSTLFSGRKKQQKARSGYGACHDESKCEPFSPAIPDWEPPRASSWERLSSWEKPSSSLWNHLSTEPHRASDADIEQLRTPAIAVRLVAPQLDASIENQESPRKGKLQWVRSLIAIKWAIKLRRRIRKKREAEQGRGESEDDDRESTMSATPSSARGFGFWQNGRLQNEQVAGGQERGFHSQRELGATWSSHYSPLLHAGSNHKSRRSNHRTADNGLLRFYLAPTKGFKIGSKRPRTHHPLIPEI